MLKRRLVQHGPSTLTISLPSDWAKEHDLRRGDELAVVKTDRGLLLSTNKSPKFDQRRIKVTGLVALIPRAIAAMYKRGYDDIVVEYAKPRELEQIHEILAKSCSGFEIVEETEGEVRIRNVSEPSHEEFRALFRRIFFFLASIAGEGLQAAKTHDKEAYHKLVLRDQNVNKLTDFCRRLVHKRKQREYESDMALYHVIEQLEKIADRYGAINTHLQRSRRKPGEHAVAMYTRANTLVRSYEKLFFDFDLQRADQLTLECRTFLQQMEQNPSAPTEDSFAVFQLETIVTDIYNLIGPTLVLHV